MPIPHSAHCSECGETLAINSRESDSDCDVFVHIDPCETCLEAAIEEAIKAENDSDT